MKIEKIFTDAPNQKVIDNAIDCIDKGNIIIIPTDSVYAFACDALNNSAIEKICSIKAIKSDRTNLSIICCDIAQASEYARIDNATFKMMRKNLPGPITFCRHSTSCQRHSRAERLWAYAFLLLALSPKWYVNSDTLLWCHLFPLSTSTTTPSRNSLPKPTTILPHLSSILAEVVQSPLL